MGLSILKNKAKVILKSINRNNAKRLFKDPIFWARFLGYAIPACFLLYILYINFLPFGYHKAFTINVGSANDTTVSEFYLEPSQDLSDRKTASDGTTYRELTGMAKAIFKPNAILKNAEITVETTDPGISLIPPYLDFDPNSVQWDKSWDFTKGVPIDLKNDNNKAFYFDNSTYFDGTARLELPNSSDMFENNPFTIYTEWMPTDDSNDGQQIIGHYNWELWQNKDSISFQIGRVNNKDGQFYNIKFPIEKDFFNKKHTAITVYSPSDPNGYIELFVDGKFGGRSYLGPDKIWNDYGNKNILLGKSEHGVAKYFKGSLYEVKLITKNILISQSKIYFTDDTNQKINILLISDTTSLLKKLNLNAIQR